jgi:hypothetical protein
MKFRLGVLIVAFGWSTQGLSAAESTAPKKSGFTIQADLNAPSLTVWMSYLLARLAYVMKHPAEYPASGRGKLIASFPEEVAGRTAATGVYQQMRLQGKNERDNYWEDLEKVSKAGYMQEYVWTYFRQTSWKESAAPKNLAQFSQWQQSRLANHRPLTYGGLAYTGAK